MLVSDICHIWMESSTIHDLVVPFEILLALLKVCFQIPDMLASCEERALSAWWSRPMICSKA